MDERQSRVLRLKTLVAGILKQDGLQTPPGWHVEMLPDGTLAVHDPSSADGNPHGRLRAGIRIEDSGARTDAALADLMAVQARAALRRMRTYAELQKSDRGFHFPVGWAALAHPLAIALGRGLVGFPEDHLPPVRRRPGDVDHPRTIHPTLFERTITWDLMATTIGTTLRMGTQEVTVRMESRPGRTDMKFDAELPETLVAALRGRPLSQLMDMPQVDGRVDAATAGLIIASAISLIGAVNPDGSHARAFTVLLAPARWLPWGTPPEDVAHLMELSPEVS